MVNVQIDEERIYKEKMRSLMDTIKARNEKTEKEKNENEFIFKVCDGTIKNIDNEGEYFVLDIGTTLLAHLPIGGLPSNMISELKYNDKLRIIITGKDYCRGYYYFSAQYCNLNDEQKKEWENVYLSYKDSKPIEVEIVETKPITVNICSGIKVSLTFEEIERNRLSIVKKNRLQNILKIYNYLMEKNNINEKISILIKKFNKSYNDNDNNVFGNITVCFANETFDHDNIFDNSEKIKYNNEQLESIIKNKKSKYFIFDTNIIMNYPDFLYLFQKNNEKYACIPFIVLEELDKIKNSDENKARKAQKAIKILHKMKESLKFEIPYPDLLPLGLDKKKNDNLILSTAIHWKNDGVEIITDDTGLLIKAYSMNIDTWALSDDISKNKK
jgi:rRNA-processing protein FCF1